MMLEEKYLHVSFHKSFHKCPPPILQQVGGEIASNIV